MQRSTLEGCCRGLMRGLLQRLIVEGSRGGLLWSAIAEAHRRGITWRSIVEGSCRGLVQRALAEARRRGLMWRYIVEVMHHHYQNAMHHDDKIDLCDDRIKIHVPLHF